MRRVMQEAGVNVGLQKEICNLQPLRLRSGQAATCNLQFPGEVPDADLKKLYAKAFGLIFPSRWEGFGLPPLESLAAGCPVLSSDRSCMPEALGSEGIIYFNPSRSDAIVRAIETVLNDPAGTRARARRIVPKLAERHDWRAAAHRTIRAFEEVLRAS